MGSSLAVWLYRVEGGGNQWFSECRRVSAPDQVSVIGVAIRPQHLPIPGSESREEFEQEAEKRADRVEWFEEPLET